MTKFHSPVLNLTQHKATPDQVAEGVFDLDGTDAVEMVALLNFVDIPTPATVRERADKLAKLARRCLPDGGAVMIGGAPYLMGPLELALYTHGLSAVYAFSLRVAVETPMPDGTVQKTMVFKHAGFVTGATVVTR